MKTLETARLTLRSWRESDLESFYAYSQNPNVGPNGGWAPHPDKSHSLSILRSFISADNVWAIVDNASRTAIGSLGLHEDEKRRNVNARSIGYVLAEEYWGRGLMTEAVTTVLDYAFAELALEIVSVYHYPFNLRSQRVIEKCGFRYEGTLRRSSTIYDGTVYDDVCYSLTREEYFDTLA